MQLVLPYIRLMRPANIITAIADILAGAVIVTGGLLSFEDFNLLWLILSTSGLYGGGVVLNDYFDAEIDRVERPERPIPSGEATRKNVLLFGSSLFFLGILAAFQVNFTAGLLAISITVFAVLYDAVTKEIDLLGPLNMGLCRGLNFLLGMSLFPQVIGRFWYLSLIPVIFIAAITLISKGEVTGSGRTPLYVAVLIYSLIAAFLLSLGFFSGSFIHNVPFVVLFFVMVITPLIKAIKDPSAGRIRTAVKLGILSLIVLNAALAATFGGFLFGLIILLLLPLSILLAKSFAVT